MLEFLKNFKVMFGSQKILGKEKKNDFLIMFGFTYQKIFKKKIKYN